MSVKYVMGILLSLDQFLNTVAGGDPDSTISGRVGYFAINTDKSYWQTLEKVIDWAFYPLEGTGHCLRASRNDSEEGREKGNGIARAVLAGIVAAFAVPFGVIVRILSIPKWISRKIK